jgi:hypothetical protein
MIRKLAVTVFAMSLTLVGCGSSSTSKKPDAATDSTTAVDVAGNKDVLTPSDTRVVDTAVLGDTSVVDTAVDTSVAAEVGPKLDVAKDTTPADTRDSGAADKTPDTFIKLDTGTVDTKIVDAPVVDTAVISDADSEVGGDAQAD